MCHYGLVSDHDDAEGFSPAVLARVVASAAGLDPEHYAVDGLYWPYPDLDLKCPRCPSCGSVNGFVYIPGIHPQGMCPSDDCDVFMWDVLMSAIENLARARRMVEEELPGGGTLTRPERDDEI